MNLSLISIVAPESIWFPFESDAAFYLALFAPSDLIIGIFEVFIGGAYLGIPQ